MNVHVAGSWFLVIAEVWWAVEPLGFLAFEVGIFDNILGDEANRAEDSRKGIHVLPVRSYEPTLVANCNALGVRISWAAVLHAVCLAALHVGFECRCYYARATTDEETAGKDVLGPAATE